MIKLHTNRLLLLLPALLLLSFTCQAQRVLLAEKVESDLSKPLGPNQQSFSHFFVGYGLVAGDTKGEGADIKYGKSNNLEVGLRYKRRVAKYYALGFDLQYARLSFRLKQNSSKTFPSPVQHHDEKLNLHQAGLVLYNRFNYGRRGDHMGNFIDIGAYGSAAFDVVHAYTNKADTVITAGAKKVKVKNKDLQYVNPWQYGVVLRVGFNRYVFTGQYRLSDLFEEKYGYAELPRMVFGLQLGLHR